VHIAIYGAVLPNTGSGPSGYYLLIEEFLRRGIQISFFCIRGHGNPTSLSTYQNFRLIAFEKPLLDWLVLKLNTRRFLMPLAFISNHFRTWRYHISIAKAVMKSHHVTPVDALLVFDQPSVLPIRPPFPYIAWPQGSPAAELDAVQARWRQAVKESGWTFVAGFILYYWYRIHLTRYQLGRADRVVCGSAWSKGAWREIGVPCEKLVSVPFPVDLARFSPTVSVPAKDGVTFLHLGRIVPRKRLDLLLDAFDRVHSLNPDAKLLIVGYVPEKCEGLRELVARAKRTQGVEYRERIDRDCVPDLLHSSDVLVQTSENENFGTSVMEALACGIPVVVGPTNGTSEFCPPSMPPFSAYTVDVVANAMIRMAAEVSKSASAMRSAARKAAEAHFCAASICERLLSEIRRQQALSN
jgi:glycosyltransferase involved in cell wall biosynthesis